MRTVAARDTRERPEGTTAQGKAKTTEEAETITQSGRTGWMRQDNFLIGTEREGQCPLGHRGGKAACHLDMEEVTEPRALAAESPREKTQTPEGEGEG